MDTSKLITVLDQAIAQDRPLEEKIFLRLLGQIWQVDWTVSPYEIFSRMMEFDLPYFLRFMSVDEGDEADEDAVIQDWLNSRSKLRRVTLTPDWRIQARALIDEVNRLRDTAGKG